MKTLVSAILLMFAVMPATADTYHKVTEIKSFNTYNSVYLGSFHHDCATQSQNERFLIDRSNIYMYSMVMLAFEHKWDVSLSWACQDIPSQGGNVPVVTAVRVKK